MSDPNMIQFEEAQKRNLLYLENEGKESPKIDGVPVLLPLTYELIQIFNDRFLREALQVDEEIEKSDENESEEIEE